MDSPLVPMPIPDDWKQLWDTKSISLAKEEIPFWHLRQKSLIQAKLGDKTGAIATARLSLAGAEKAKNNDYVKMNNDSIKEWSKK